MDNRTLLNDAERAADPDRYASVAGAGRRARGGDTISSILGTSKPQAIGNFMRANGLTSSGIREGQNYFVPDDTAAYGDGAALGQAVLSRDNARIAALAAQRQAAQSMVWGSSLSMDGSGGSFSALSAAQPSMFDETQSWKVGLNGRIEGNMAYAGPGAMQVPMAVTGVVNSNFFGMVKDATLTASGDLGVWGDKQGGALGTFAYGVGGLGYMVGTALPGSAGEAAFIAATGPMVGAGLGLVTDATISKMPWLGMSVGDALSRTGMSVGNTGAVGPQRTVLSTSGAAEQAQLASSMIPGLTEAQAKVLLEGAFNPNKPVEVVLGGSRVRSYFGEGTFRADSDLDIGFNAKMKNNQVDRILDAFDAQGPLQSERGIRIFSGNNPPSGPIDSPQEFFQRSGVRGPFPPERAGEPFGPSGFFSFHPDGTVTIVPPGGGL